MRFVSTWITAALRDRKFFSLAEAQKAVQEKLEELNCRPFKKRPGCRFTAYEQEEKAFMRPLPVHSYEPAVWLHPKVGYDYLVSDGVNKYSIPYDLIGEKVDVRLTSQIVEVFYKQTRVAAHIRLDKPQRDPVVKPEHMPESHRRYLNYNTEDFTVWANTVGPNTAETVQFFLTSGKEAEQGFKACASLTKLGSRYGTKRLEDACERVLRLTSMPTIRNISALCKASLERKEEAPQEVRKEGSHGITRGAAYYRKGGSAVNNPSTIQQLRDMKFSAMANELELQLRDPAPYAQVSFDDRLGLLVNAEWNRRQANKLKRRICDARLDIPSATPEGIEYYEDRKLDKAEMVRFATCGYIDEEHHIILKGATGSGKTYLACALGNAACRKYKTVRYVRMPELLDELTIARAENQFRKVTKPTPKRIC